MGREAARGATHLAHTPERKKSVLQRHAPLSSCNGLTRTALSSASPFGVDRLTGGRLTPAADSLDFT